MKPPRKVEDVAAAALSVPERMLLFCIASDTDWQKAGITGATITAMVVKGLIDRDAASSGSGSPCFQPDIWRINGSA
jgi:hypothetical protein